MPGLENDQSEPNPSNVASAFEEEDSFGDRLFQQKAVTPAYDATLDIFMNEGFTQASRAELLTGCDPGGGHCCILARLRKDIAQLYRRRT